MSAYLAVFLLLVTLSLFAWLTWTHPMIAAAWFILALLLTLFFGAAVKTIQEGEHE